MRKAGRQRLFYHGTYNKYMQHSNMDMDMHTS